MRQYGAHPTVAGEDGTEQVLMRVVVWGGGDKEGKFLQQLSEKASGSLVSGLYVLWDPRLAVGGRFAGTLDDVQTATHESRIVLLWMRHNQYNRFVWCGETLTCRLCNIDSQE